MFHVVCLSPVQVLASSISADPPFQRGRRISDSLPGSELEIAQFNVSGSPPCSMELFVPYPCPSVLHSSSSWLIHKGCQLILPDLDPVLSAFCSESHGLGKIIFPGCENYLLEALTLLNRTLPSRNLLYRKELNRTLPNQETDKTESGKPHSAQPESDKPNLGIC